MRSASATGKRFCAFVVFPHDPRNDLASGSVDLNLTGEHEEQVSLSSRLAPLLISSLLLLEGCALLHPSKKEAAVPTASAATLANQTQGPPSVTAPAREGFFSRLFHHSPRPSPPKKATALRRIGTVTTVSNDGSYVIVELEAGVTVATGATLLITATGGEPARLKVAELEFPYFVADIETGHPSHGDPVMQ